MADLFRTLTNSEKMNVFIQTGDTTIDMSAYVKSVSVSSGLMDECMTCSLELLIPSSVDMFADDGNAVDVKKVKSAKEWKCQHCQAVNLRAERECGKCGAPRPFIYD